MLEPGARVSHAAVALAARVGCLLVWIGEAGVRLYSAGQPGGARADRLLHQARLALDPDARLKVVRKMYDMRFGEPAPQRRSVDQLRGIEGARVKRLYEVLARQYGVKWKGRRYDPGQWQAADLPNRCLSQGDRVPLRSGRSCCSRCRVRPGHRISAHRQGSVICLRCGRCVQIRNCRPDCISGGGTGANGGKQPAAGDPVGEVRRGCRDSFRKTGLLNRLIPGIEEMLSARRVRATVGAG